ncbi:MAG: cbiD [Rhodospirillaceae bacterium]|nr:MAG: cbiD [Rhodospirillaceae bacterium]
MKGAHSALRMGWTTGACSTAAVFDIHHGTHAGCTATASVLKDAGDDPDITHGAEIVVTVAPGPAGQGLLFRAGAGVGTVTRPGLPLAVGEAAITPGPRAMIARTIDAVRLHTPLPPDLSVTIGVTNGAVLARRTLNARLGILGGLSILGTTGVVVPYSCSAWVAALHRGVDVARAAGLAHIAGATGRTSEEAVRRLYDLPEMALIDMGGFVGALLNYLRRHPVPRLTLAGGFAKMTKLAQGALDLHSQRSRFDPEPLARLAAGASGAFIAVLAGAGSAGQALALAQAEGIDLAGGVARKARAVAATVVGSSIDIDVAVFDRTGILLAMA